MANRPSLEPRVARRDLALCGPLWCRDAQWQASGAVRYALDRAAYAADLASVQSKLSGDEFASGWTEGHRLSREQAVAYALACVEDRLAATRVSRSSPL